MSPPKTANAGAVFPFPALLLNDNIRSPLLTERHNGYHSAAEHSCTHTDTGQEMTRCDDASNILRVCVTAG